MWSNLHPYNMFNKLSTTPVATLVSLGKAVQVDIRLTLG